MLKTTTWVFNPYQDSVAEALNYESAPSNLDRFNKPMQPYESMTYGFKGFPEMNMLQPKRPLRQQASADITHDVNRYFRKDSATEWKPSAPRPMTPPKESHEQQQPAWLPPKQNEAHSPAPAPKGTISPRYQDEGTARPQPVIRDPRGELTSAERRKKIEEHYIAEQDLAEAHRRKEEQQRAKIEEQRKPRFDESPSRMERGAYSERRGDILRQQEREIDEARRKLNRLEQERQMDQMEGKNDFGDEKMEMMEEQAMQLRRMQDEIARLKAQDDMSYHRPHGDRPYENGRAQSVKKAPVAIFSSKTIDKVDKKFLGYFFSAEPQTDRTWRKNRDRDFFGHTDNLKPLEYETTNTPRRRPVGQLYYKDSTYQTDFDPPFLRHRDKKLPNYNKESWEPFSPFGQPGSGAPLADTTGQRKTRIQGSMGILGRELSDSARARRAHKQELLHTIGEQAAYERARKDAEKAYAREGFVEVADKMRQQKVGYPSFKPSGLIDNHHLPHTISNPYPHVEVKKQREYHDFLQNQIGERNRNIRLGQLEEKRQAREHFKTHDSYFGKYGGGNLKGEDLRKVNLDRAIHNPQTRMNYRGGAPYASTY